MSPSPRVALLAGVAAVAALLVGPLASAAAVVVLVGAALADALMVRRAPAARRQAPRTLSRGIAAPLQVEVAAGRATVRQPSTADLRVTHPQAEDGLDTTLVATRRGRHTLPPVALRLTGPLGLGRWDHRAGGAVDVRVYPDLVTARRLALAVREGRRRDPGLRARGPLGLGTEFERVRDYVPDDDIRQVNWRATARTGRPMSNEHRVETERDVWLCVDAGRLMGAPIGDRTRLDGTLDAAAAVAYVADELADRCGAVAYDDRVLRHVPAGRASGRDVVEALYDLEPSRRDADPEAAFRLLSAGKRAFVLVLCDLLEETAARPLLSALPALTRSHAVVVASLRDRDVEQLVATVPDDERGALVQVAALDVLAARDRVCAHVRATGALVVEAPAERLAATCVQAYLRLKARGRF